MSAEQIQIIIYASVAVGSFLLTAIPSIIGIVASLKKKKAAKTEAEIAAAQNELTSYAQELIVSAESTYKAVDKVLKQQGSASAGAMKKDSVMSKLQAFAIEKGFDFDVQTWSEKIDSLVEFSKAVNGK